MLIEYIYGIIFFVLPVVGMFVAVIVGGVRNIERQQALELQGDTALIGRVEKDGVNIERKKIQYKEMSVINTRDGSYRNSGVDYGLASKILSTRRKRQLASWLKHNRVKKRKVYFHQRAGP